MSEELVIEALEDIPVERVFPRGISVGGLVVLALATGAVIGYKIGVKKTTLKYEEILEEQMQKAEAFYSRKYKSGEFETPESAAEVLGADAAPPLPAVQGAAVQALRDYQGSSSVGEGEETRHNVFDAPPEFDLEQEQSKREARPGEPYVISKDEFDEADGQQVRLTYFVEDDVLIDEHDKAVEDVDMTIGEDNLQRFGHGSGDNRIVYIQNERLDLYFEVVKSDSSYARDVLGFTEDQTPLAHSERRGARSRRRTED